jgi:hypothetical protein
MPTGKTSIRIVRSPTIEIEIVARQATFAREIAAEIEGVVAGLEAYDVVFAERWHKTFVVRQCGQHLWRRARDVKKETDAILVATLACALASGIR